MKTFILQKLEVASRSEYSAREILFHDTTTILTGENQRGKSSLLKTVFWCLGASPKFSDEWKKADIIGRVTFSLENQVYSCLRYKDIFFVVVPDSGKVVLKTSKLPTFSKFMAKLLDFELLINSRDDKPVIPPPAFFFLPFYIDQDLSWNASWNGFLNLNQFANWKKDVSEYHVGLYDNAYFREKTRLEDLKGQLDAPQLEMRALMRTIDAVRQRMPPSTISINSNVFDSDIEDLVAKANELAIQQELIRTEKANLQAEVASLKQQVAILTAVAVEMKEDYQFAVDHKAHSLECPLCGAFYENSIGERFHIALTSERCTEFAASLQDEADDLLIQEKDMDRKYQLCQAKSTEVDAILSRTRNDVKLHDVVLGLARDSALGPLEDQLRSCNQRIESIEALIQQAKAAVESYKNATRRRSFVSEFTFLVDTFSRRLNVPPLKSGTSFSPVVKATGSDLPRALLAYYYAVLHMLWKHNRAARFPIIVDTFNQQDQDPENLKRMNRLVFDDRPEGAQVIVGIRSRPPEAPSNLNQITLLDERKVLDSQNFETVRQLLESELERARLTRESR